jgi:hypothetical protein
MPPPTNPSYAQVPRNIIPLEYPDGSLDAATLNSRLLKLGGTMTETIALFGEHLAKYVRLDRFAEFSTAVMEDDWKDHIALTEGTDYRNPLVQAGIILALGRSRAVSHFQLMRGRLAELTTLALSEFQQWPAWGEPSVGDMQLTQRRRDVSVARGARSRRSSARSRAASAHASARVSDSESEADSVRVLHQVLEHHASDIRRRTNEGVRVALGQAVPIAAAHVAQAGEASVQAALAHAAPHVEGYISARQAAVEVRSAEAAAATTQAVLAGAAPHLESRFDALARAIQDLSTSVASQERRFTDLLNQRMVGQSQIPRGREEPAAEWRGAPSSADSTHDADSSGTEYEGALGRMRARATHNPSRPPNYNIEMVRPYRTYDPILDPNTVETPALRRSTFFTQGKRSLRIWAAAGVGTRADVTAAFQSGWDAKVVARVPASMREMAKSMLPVVEAMCVTLAAGLLTRVVHDHYVEDVAYVTNAAAFDVPVATGIRNASDASAAPRSLQQQVQLQRWICGQGRSGPMASRRSRAAAADLGAAVPSESEIERRDLARDAGRSASNRGEPRRRGRRHQRRPPSAHGPPPQQGNGRGGQPAR